MPDPITTNPQRSEPMVDKEGLATDQLLEYFDDIELSLNESLLGASGIELKIYTVATLPPQKEGFMIYVINEVGGSIPAFSDGTNWRRVTDRAIIS